MTDHYVAAPQRREMPSANRSRKGPPRTRHYVMTEQLRNAGFQPVGADLSELLKGGGSIKCCTLEVLP